MPNQRVKSEAGSRQEKCVGAHLAQSDWLARVRTRGIDWLGTTRSHARIVFPERSVMWLLTHAGFNKWRAT